MAIIARLAGEGIGPFKKFDFDFSDESGSPHPGPHVLAGVNGSGKSTILKTLAWLVEWLGSSDGFPWEEWEHLVQGHELSRAMIVVCPPASSQLSKSESLEFQQPFAWAQTMDTSDGWEERLRQWMMTLLNDGKVLSLRGKSSTPFHEIAPDPDSVRVFMRGRRPAGYMRIGGPKNIGWRQRILVAAYGPSRTLRHLPEVDLSAHLKNFRENSLSFGATVTNEIVQSWLLGLLSKEALAKAGGRSVSKYSAALERFQVALKEICGQDVEFTVEIEPSLHPKLRMGRKLLDFSQLPDGVRGTVGWLTDFMMRMEAQAQAVGARDRNSNVLLLDEIDVHLHPKWQRSILPSIKKALPTVQVFATSHSPFVISSCRSARIHLLTLNDSGVASNLVAQDAPVGESIQATMADIFGVSSRFDVETEGLLEKWNQLQRKQAKGGMSQEDQMEMAALTTELASRSEELRQIVSPLLPIRNSLVHKLHPVAESSGPTRTKARK